MLGLALAGRLGGPLRTRSLLSAATDRWHAAVFASLPRSIVSVVGGQWSVVSGQENIPDY
jgi:hypothetical protein